MHACLDVNPADFGWGREETARGGFVFIAQGDPRVNVPTWEGMGWVKKDIVPMAAQGTLVYDVDGQGVTVAAVSLPALMKDVGVEHFRRMRLSGQYAEPILAELPGPVATEIVCDPMPKEIVAHLMQWYTLGIRSLRRNPIYQELVATFMLRTAR